MCICPRSGLGSAIKMALLLTQMPIATVAVSAEVSELFDMSLEELANVEVTTVYKRPSNWSDTPAAIYVLTRRDIELSGAETLGDLLLRVPGVNVRQLSRQRYAVSFRNDTHLYLNNMLVMLDGYSIDSPSMQAPFFEQLDIAIEDIERIEIIRGSGGSSWGANSAGGVINIISRRASDGERLQLQADAGSQSRQHVYAAGALAGNEHALRVSADSEKSDGFTNDNPTPEMGERRIARLRWDYDAGNLQSHLFASRITNERTENSLLSGLPESGESWTNMVAGGVEYALSEADSLAVRLNWRDNETELPVIELNTYAYQASDIGVDYERRFDHGFLTINTLYRRTYIDGQEQGLISYLPPEFESDWKTWGLTWHGEINDSWQYDLGARAEQYTVLEEGWHYAPTLRLSYHHSESLMFWSSAIRTYQFPNHGHLTNNITTGLASLTPLTVNKVAGNPALEPEEITSYEFGGRWQPTAKHWLDFTLYNSKIDDAIHLDPSSLVSVPGANIQTYNNFGQHRTRGAEFIWRYQYSERLLLEWSASWFGQESKSQDERPQFTAPDFAPEWKLAGVATWHLGNSWDLSSVLVWEDDYYSENSGGGFLARSSYTEIPAHYRLDMFVRKSLTPHVNLRFGARNLFNDEINWDYGPGITPAQLVEPSVFVGIEARLQ